MGLGKPAGFCHAGPVGTGPVSDLPTHARHRTCDRLPAGQPPIPTLRRGRCLPYACLHSSKVSDLPSPCPAVSHHLLPAHLRLVPVLACANLAVAASHLVSPLGHLPPGRLACAISSMPSRAQLFETALSRQPSPVPSSCAPPMPSPPGPSQVCLVSRQLFSRWPS